MPTRTALAADEEDRRVLARARLRLLLYGVLSFLVLAGLVVLLAQVMAGRRAERDARERADVVASTVEATLDRTTGDTGDALRDMVHSVADDLAVTHVMVWRLDGEVYWSDDPATVGRRFAMGEELRALFLEGGSLLGRPGPVDLETAVAPEGAEDDYEVFTRARGPMGEPLVVETYVDGASLAEHRTETLWLLVPLALAAVLLVELAGFFSAMSLVHQVQRGRRDRLAIVNRAMLAVEHERREVAHQLHDGVVQDLAATRYAIGALAETLPVDTPPESRATLQRISDVLEDELKDLRGMLGHLVPPDVESRNLEEALRALVRHLVPPELSCRLVVECRAISPAEGRTAYRVVREGVRNAVAHSGAEHLLVAVATTRDDHLSVLVEDDGHGLVRDRFQGDDRVEERPSYGLQLLHGLLHDVGGSLVVGERAPSGVALTATFPIAPEGGPRHQPVRHLGVRALTRG